MLSLLLVALINLSQPITFPAQSFFGVGGPDVYGYRWIDSDTTAPGAPTYNWIDITQNGIRITGLADDNVVGPFPIGFEFPYYWYRVNSFYVGSNGYISFNDNGLYAHPFPRLPDPNLPNDVLAPMMCDLDFGAGNPSCYYYTNNRDTCIISFINVPFWNTGGSNTFQIILSRADSAIYFQYQTQNGAPYNGWQSAGSSAIGIENIVGRIGLSYLAAGQPNYNLPHANLAIKFYPPATTNYQARDIACWSVMNDKSEGVFIHIGDTCFPVGKVKNTGSVPTGAFPVFCRIRSGTSVVYADTFQVSGTNPGEVVDIRFSRNFRPTTQGLYTMVIRSALSGDSVPGNDSIVLEMRVIQYPAELKWEDLSTPRALYYWNGPGGYGNKFYPPRYPTKITGAKIFASASPATSVSVLVLDDNGPLGSPGETLFQTTVSISTQQWYTVNFPTPVNITSGGFFIGFISATANQPSFGMDTLPPSSRLCWEYTTSWSPYRNPKFDVMIRALVDVGLGVKEIAQPKEISFLPTVMKIKDFCRWNTATLYNVCGLPVKKERLTTGLYFLKENARIRKVILVE